MYPLYPLCWEFLSYMDVELCQKLFLPQLRWFLFFSLLMWCITSCIEPSLHPWDKSQLIMVYDPLNVLLDLVCLYFTEDFCIYVHQWYWTVIFPIHLSGFCIRVMLASQYEFRSISSSAIFWNSLRRMSVNSSLNVW